VRRGVPIAAWETSAWSSSSTGRVPSRLETTTEPGASRGRSARKNPDGFFTSTSPPSTISKTPISFVEPKRFFTARSTRYE
jgi:hypothetical protein